MQKTTILRVLGDNGTKGSYRKINNIANFEPRKNDHLVINKVSYIVSYVEYDFDDEIMYIVAKEN
jgi:hypothetical protein